MLYINITYIKPKNANLKVQKNLTFDNLLQKLGRYK